ncbi:unnamed protein product [Adineta ricciae]|uniref:ADP ribosyltransferase domain-containing protein n=1 Tax=Adineta ricciae TaxID=249248 RepID=A0A816DUI7_ADIRI|nr:unnamed protein product [Adineta ricciae]
MDAQKSKSSSTTRKHGNQQRQRMVQNYLLVWVNTNIDEKDEDRQNTLTHLRSVVNDVNIYTQPDACVQFLNSIGDEKAFVITSGSLGQQLVPEIHDIPQVNAIYIFCSNKSRHETWTKSWSKVKGVHTNIKEICEALTTGVKQYNQDSIAISLVPVIEEGPNANLNQLEPSFMYTQIFKKILLDMEHDKQGIKDLLIYCRQCFQNNIKEQRIIGEFERNYRPDKAIWWYTRECFTYQMLNQALRTLDGELIINMGFFLHDLHKQIQQLHQAQVSNYKRKPFVVYRGQGLCKKDFDQLSKTVGGLLSFNNFLSTSIKQQKSLVFTYSALSDPDKVGVLFVITIDPNISTTPFASVRGVSYFEDEAEILFSMHSVFRVGTIRQVGDKNKLHHEVQLQLTADDDPQLRVLTDRIEREVQGSTGWQCLGKLLLKLGQLDKAEELYAVLLEQTSNKSDTALYYHQLGYLKDDQGDYKMAIEYYEKALKIQETTLPSNHPSLATSYSNIALVYDKMGEYSKALSFFEKALEIEEKTLPSNHPDLAQSYNNIGLVYYNMGEYSKALSFYEKALEIREKTLPSNHPDLAQSYNNIGGVYDSMGEYSKALSFYEKALEIREKTLPSNHPSLATSYNNIGFVYYNMGEYSKALSFYEKALEIWGKTLPSNHPSLAASYNNIGLVYNNMGEYSKALSFYEKAFEIREKTLPSNHPSLATSYNNIGAVYQNMGEYSKAYSFYEKALEISGKSLPSNHPDLATSYNNIGLVYNNMGEYSKALSFYEKAFEIWEKSLPSNHPDLATSYNNIGGVYKNMGEYSKALSFYEKAFEIWGKTLPSNHPSLATSYNNIGLVYYNMEEYSKALSFYEKSLAILEKSLPSNHPSLAASYNNIGLVYNNMAEYSKALSFYEKALEIREKTLPSNHPDLAQSYNNIGLVYYNMGEYSKALTYFERALDIRQRALPANHPDINDVKENIESCKRAMKE